MSHTMPCGITVSGEVHSLAQLSAKFQIKARKYELSDSESLALWIEGNTSKVQFYFMTRMADYHHNLESAKTKLQFAPKTWNL